MNLTGINKRYFIAVTVVLAVFMAAMIVAQIITGSALTAVLIGTVIGAGAASALREYASVTL